MPKTTDQQIAERLAIIAYAATLPPNLQDPITWTDSDRDEVRKIVLALLDAGLGAAVGNVEAISRGMVKGGVPNLAIAIMKAKRALAALKGEKAEEQHPLDLLASGLCRMALLAGSSRRG